MCHDLKPIADRSEVMCYDQKRLKFGLFVIFHDLSPITREEKVVGYGLEGLKIGKKVICHDLKPIADRLEVICCDFEPIMDRVEVMSHHFEAVANRSERMVKTLVILPKLCCQGLAFSMRPLRRAGPVPCGNQLCGDDICRFKTNQCLTLKLLEK